MAYPHFSSEKVFSGKNSSKFRVLCLYFKQNCFILFLTFWKVSYFFCQIAFIICLAKVDLCWILVIFTKTSAYFKAKYFSRFFYNAILSLFHSGVWTLSTTDLQKWPELWPEAISLVVDVDVGNTKIIATRWLLEFLSFYMRKNTLTFSQSTPLIAPCGLWRCLNHLNFDLRQSH